jgi:hypothetical protein
MKPRVHYVARYTYDFSDVDSHTFYSKNDKEALKYARRYKTKVLEELINYREEDKIALREPGVKFKLGPKPKLSHIKLYKLTKVTEREIYDNWQI